MKTVIQLIEANIVAIIMGVVSLVLSYAIGTTRTGVTIADLTARVDALEKRAGGLDATDQCVTRHLDAIELGARTPPTCHLGPSE